MEGDFLTYALNDSGKMVFVDDVPNGLACNCRCPFIADYQDRILSWAVPILNLPPQTIIDQQIGVDYTNYNRIAYVRYNYRNYYIYPKGNEFENEEHKRRCSATYRLFKELYDFCQNYVNAKECHDFCSYYKACFEYRKQRYVFCSNKKKHQATM